MIYFQTRLFFSCCTNYILGPLKESLEAIADIQSEIDRVNEKSSEEIINVEQKFNKLRKPVFSKRQALVQNVSGISDYSRLATT